MVFSSGVFLFAFLPALLILYFLPLPFAKTGKWRNIILLLFSLGFYWYGEPKFFWLMLLSIAVNWAFGILIDKHRAHTKLWVTLSVVYDVGLLFVFKYLNFFTENLSKIFGKDNWVTHIALPIGISFFMFQMMSYIFDVAMGKAQCQRNILNLALYITMFPQLIAGPIVRYETVAGEIENRRENWNDFSDGMCRFVWGLAKKVILANNLGLLADLVFDSDYADLSSPVAWIGAIAYTLQILFDFSGYSDMAIGLGRMFGFHFLENFNYPYLAGSVSEFWRRWHISMGTWFRDYVYFPLGGSRTDSRLKVFRNLMIVWLLTGIWHGANWTFVLWGGAYGILIALEKFTGFTKKLGGFSHVYTMFCVVTGWALFRSDSVAKAGMFLKAMFGFGAHGHLAGAANLLLHYGGIFIILGLICCFPVKNLIKKCVKSKPLYEAGYVISLLAVFAISMLYVVKGGYNPFIYFNF